MCIKVSEPEGTRVLGKMPLIIHLSGTKFPRVFLARTLSATGIDLSACFQIYGVNTTKELHEYIEGVIHYVSAILVCGKQSLLTFLGKKNIARRDGEMGMYTSTTRMVQVPMLFTYSAQEVNLDRERRYNYGNHIQYFAHLVNGTTLKLAANYMFDFDAWDIKKICDLMERTETLSFDIESTGLDPLVNDLTVIGLAGRLTNGQLWAGTFAQHADGNMVVNPTDWESIRRRMPDSIIAHHSRFDNNFLAEKEYTPLPVSLDTMQAANLENELQSKKLKHLLRAKLVAEPYEMGIEFGAKSTTSRSDMRLYCAKDCIGTLLLGEYYMGEGFPVQRVDGSHYSPSDVPSEALMEYTMDVERMLQRIERRGIRIDKDALTTTKEAITQKMEETHAKLVELAGGDINFNSPVQLQKLLYEDLRLPVMYKDDLSFEADEENDEEYTTEVSHTPTTNSAALKTLAHAGHEICRVLLEYRKYAKMLNGFLTPWENEMTLRDSTILHPAYNSATARTFRLSSSGPNLQQVSRDPAIRTLVVPPKRNYVFIEADHSQIELRVAAVIGNIQSMKDIYLTGGDIHTNTARAICALGGIDYDTLTKADQKTYRTRAKAVNFGFIYGMSAKGFQTYAAASYDVYLTLREAEAFRNVFFRLYPELKPWHDETKRKALETGVAVLGTGRVRHLPNVYSPNEYLKSKALRQAVNTPVQGLASEIMLLGMLYLEKSLAGSVTTTLIGQCHDAVFVQCPNTPKDIDDACFSIHQSLTGVMCDPLMRGVPWGIPLEVEIKVGKSWGDPLAEVWKKTS